MNDIPEALRYQGNTDKASKRFPGLAIAGLLGLGAIVVGGSTFFLRGIPQSQTDSPVVQKQEKPIPQSKSIGESKSIAQSKPTKADNLLGHLKYEEAPTSDLKALTPNGRIKLRTTAAAKFKQMQAAARAEGIILVPISGFRSISQQQYLFFKVKEKRGQVTTERAKVSAPPGHSEHHTGYAIDIGDGKVPATHLHSSFEKTAAFRWLEKNAARYSFELSFPRDNIQGISYEPWHWRFVGDRHSLETFYKARNL